MILAFRIKPSNIMITPNEDICVIDFNTSLVFSKGVLAIGATPGYAAPEQYTRPGASPDTIETVPLEETMPLRGYKDAFAYQNVRSNKGPSGRGVSNSVTAAQATNAGGYGTISKRTDVYGIGATLYYAITGQQPGHSLKDVRPITSYKLKFSRSFLLIIARAMMKRQEERFCDAQEMLRALQDIHAIDGRYKKVVHSQRVVAAVSLVLAVSGTLAILFGVQRIGVERYAAYDALVRKGRTAADEMRFDEAEQDLQQAIAIYDDQLEAYVEQAVLLYRQGKYQECICHVGDCRTYIISDTLTQLTTDHTIVQRELTEGKLTPEQARKDSRQSLLLQCVGAGKDVKPDYLSGEVLPHRTFLICCDGFRRKVTEAEIKKSCRYSSKEKKLHEALEETAQLCMKRKETDNITGILISAVGEKKGLFPLWKKATQTAGKKVIKDILLEHSTPADKIL